MLWHEPYCFTPLSRFFFFCFLVISFPYEMSLTDNPAIASKRTSTLTQRLFKHVRMPSFAIWRKPCKQSVALLLGIIMTLDDRTRTTVGQGSLLCAIVVVFYFPARTFGVVVEVRYNFSQSG
ncbi:hypothetical protein BX666DRAFT_735984 [Dichotomocladium elegans]|nr:hypothetical protein BX666DRAFT_735984 [Dichotomocladium elegans]